MFRTQLSSRVLDAEPVAVKPGLDLTDVALELHFLPPSMGCACA